VLFLSEICLHFSDVSTSKMSEIVIRVSDTNPKSPPPKALIPDRIGQGVTGVFRRFSRSGKLHLKLRPPLLAGRLEIEMVAQSFVGTGALDVIGHDAVLPNMRYRPI
jgi:hypothetical protein